MCILIRMHVPRTKIMKTGMFSPDISVLRVGSSMEKRMPILSWIVDAPVQKTNKNGHAEHKSSPCPKNKKFLIQNFKLHLHFFNLDCI